MLLVLCEVHYFTPWLSWQALLRGCVLCEVLAEDKASTVFSMGYELKKQHHPYSTTWHNQMAAPLLVKLTLCLI
jgi:hypothetical protein